MLGSAQDLTTVAVPAGTLMQPIHHKSLRRNLRQLAFEKIQSPEGPCISDEAELIDLS